MNEMMNEMQNWLDARKDDLLIILEEAKDVSLAAIASGTLLAPEVAVAGAGVYLLHQFQKLYGNRSRMLLEETVSDLKNLKGKLDSQYVDKAEYSMLFVKSAESYVRADREEKIRYYKNFLLNAATKQLSEVRTKDRYLRIIDALLFDEIESLIYLISQHTYTTEDPRAKRDYIPAGEIDTPEQRIRDFISGKILKIKFELKKVAEKEKTNTNADRFSVENLLPTFLAYQSQGLCVPIVGVFGADGTQFQTSAIASRFFEFIIEPQK